MEKNKVTTYLLYAVGEIVLVVIGIIIAIQLNAWSQKKKDQEKTATNLSLLIESLERDSLYFTEVLERVNEDRAFVLSLYDRMNNPSLTLDSLKVIVTREYRPGITNTFFRNDDPYLVMVQSGEITLLQKTIRQQLFSLYSNHERFASSLEEHFNTYHYMISQFFKKYPNPGLLNKGPIYDEIWSNASLSDLGGEFSGVMGAKLNHYRLESRYLLNLIEETSETLKQLRNYQF